MLTKREHGSRIRVTYFGPEGAEECSGGRSPSNEDRQLIFSRAAAQAFAHHRLPAPLRG
jgi:hypothetical protein